MTDKSLPPRYCFSAAEEHIFILMSKDSYPRFVRSEIYKGVLNNAQQQGAKKVNWKYVRRFASLTLNENLTVDHIFIKKKKNFLSCPEPCSAPFQAKKRPDLRRTL